MARRDRLPPDPTHVDTPRRPETETPGVQVHEANLGSYARQARPSDTTDLDWHATPLQPERAPVPDLAATPPPTSTPGPSNLAAIPDAPTPFWTPTPIPEQRPAARLNVQPPAPPEVRQAPVAAPPRPPEPSEEPARPRRRAEPMPFAQRALQVTVLSVLAGGLAAVGAVIASSLTSGTEGLSVTVPAEPPPVSAPAGPP